MRDLWVLCRGELIGLSVEVVSSTDLGLVGVTGRVVDETKHTLVVRRGNGRALTVPKRVARFRFTRDGVDMEVDGGILAFRPEDRPKKIRMKHLRDDGNACEEEGREEAEGPGHRRGR